LLIINFYDKIIKEIAKVLGFAKHHQLYAILSLLNFIYKAGVMKISIILGHPAKGSFNHAKAYTMKAIIGD